MLRLPAPALTAVAVAALLALSGCAGKDATVSSPPPAAPTDAAAGPTASPSADTAQVVTLTVVGGKVTGDAPRVKVALGSRVRVTVTSDVSDQVHLHGYDLQVATAIGSPVQIEFVADKPGIYAIELENSGRSLTRLQVA